MEGHKKSRTPWRAAFGELTKSGLPRLSARVSEVGLKSKFGWELGQAVTWIHLDTVVIATAGVRWLEGSVESGPVESNQFVESISNALKGTARSIDNTVRPTGFAAIGFGLADNLLRNFNDSIEDIADGTSELAG